MFSGLGRIRFVPFIAALATAFVVPIALGTALQVAEIEASQRAVVGELRGNVCLHAAYGALTDSPAGRMRAGFDPTTCAYRSTRAFSPSARIAAENTIVARMGSIGDRSGLSYDPRPAVVNLADVEAYALPETRVHLTQAAVEARVAAAKLQATALDQLVAADEDIRVPNLPSRDAASLRTALDATERAVRPYSTLLDAAEAAPPGRGPSRAALSGKLRPAVAAIDALFYRTNEALGRVLTAERAALRRRLYAVLGMAAVALALTLTILVAMLRFIEGRDRSEFLRVEQEAARLQAEVARHEAEQLLRANEAQFQAVFAGSPLAIAIVDADAFIIECNEAYFHFVGPSATTRAPRQLFAPLRVVHERDWRMLRDAMGSHPRGTFEIELALRRAGDAEVWCHTFVSIIHTAEGTGSHCAVMLQDTTERKRMEGRLQYAATHDGLTGLTNRLHFVSELERRLQLPDADGARFAVVFVDVDDFKSVNDTLGHAAGDECLRTVAERLCRIVRQGDTVARFGGDEFAIVLADPASIRHVDDVARRIVEAFDVPIELREATVRTSVSVGIARDRSAATTSERVLADADIAMYRHKAGRGERCAVIETAGRRFDDSLA